MYGQVPSLFTWNCNNIVNWLYSNTKCFGLLKKIKLKKNKKAVSKLSEVGGSPSLEVIKQPNGPLLDGGAVTGIPIWGEIQRGPSSSEILCPHLDLPHHECLRAQKPRTGALRLGFCPRNHGLLRARKGQTDLPSLDFQSIFDYCQCQWPTRVSGLRRVGFQETKQVWANHRGSGRR